jgi:rhamnosyltransferase
MNKIQKYAATVILYNPPDETISNLLSYYNQVNTLYIIDNSEKPNDILILEFEKLDKVVYHTFNSNKGIAFALNFAAKLAINDGFDYLFTFDQDSSFSKGVFKNYLDSINLLNLEKVGIISPFHEMNGYNSDSFLSETTDILTVATSGNLLNLRIFKELEGFLEKLFIDYVDNEYCLRLGRKGYRVVRFNKILMNHNLGDLSIKSIFGKKISVTNHSAIRLYYRVRNRLFVISKNYLIFPKYSYLMFRLIFTDILKILIFEKDRVKKLHMMLIGFVHFFQNRFGMY